MVLRKIVAMIICSLLSPIVFAVRWLPNVWNAVFYGKYEYYDFHITSLRQFLVTLYGEGHIITMILSLVLIFIPFQLIKDLLRRKGYHLSFFKRIGILFGILAFLTVVSGLISEAMWLPWRKSLLYVVFLTGFSLFYTTISHFIVDRYQEKPNLQPSGMY